jgi:predicted O-methyltransferase YrrM
MLDRVRHRARQAIRQPNWVLSAINTRVEWQRRLGLEPPEFTHLANEVLSGIEGWRYRQDLGLLYLLARDVPGPGVVLEIGSYKGLATTALAYGAKHGRRERVHTVDPHTGDRQDLEAGGHRGSSEEEFQRNMQSAGLADEVVSYTMTSNELAERWSGERIRVLFVDGWHSYEAVTSDIRNWVPLLSSQGVVLIDDYRNYDDVRRAVDDARSELPAQQRRAGRMWLASSAPLPDPVERFLRMPWG